MEKKYLSRTRRVLAEEDMDIDEPLAEIAFDDAVRADPMPAPPAPPANKVVLVNVNDKEIIVEDLVEEVVVEDEEIEEELAEMVVSWTTGGSEPNKIGSSEGTFELSAPFPLPGIVGCCQAVPGRQ